MYRTLLTLAGAVVAALIFIVTLELGGPQPPAWLVLIAVGGAGLSVSLGVTLPVLRHRQETERPTKRETEPTASFVPEPDTRRLAAPHASLLGSVVGQYPAPLMILDGDLRVVAINKQAETLLGLPGLATGDDIRPFCDDDERVLAADVLCAAESVMREAGTTRPIQLSDHEQPWEVTRLAFGGRVFARITTPTPTGQETNPHEQTLELAAHVGHELRTPLVAIRGYSELLASGSLGDLNERQKKVIENSLRNLDRLVHLIDDVLDLGRMRRGADTLVSSRFDLAEMTREVTDLMKMRALENGVELEVRADENLVVTADRIKLHQVLTNLVSNGVRFTDIGGRIAVRARLATASEEQDIGRKMLLANKSTDEAAAWVLLRVSDNGIGIPDKHLARVFDRFFTTTAGGGTGLGLAITDDIVRMHGGFIEVSSEVGRGSVFFVWLPIGQPNVRPPRVKVGPTAELRLRAPSGHVLVVEDEPDIGELARFVLEQDGHKVDVAVSAEQMWERLQDEAVDMILLDYTLSDADGLDILNLLKSSEEYRRLPVAVVSARRDEELRQKCLDAGSFRYLTKPFAIDDLASVVSSGLESRARRDTLTTERELPDQPRPSTGD